MAARGNRLVGVGRFGVAILATAAVALAALEPAYAEEAAPTPATETMNSESTPAPAPPDETTAAPTAPAEQAPTPASEEPAAEPSSTPPAAPASADEPAETTPTTDGADAEQCTFRNHARGDRAYAGAERRRQARGSGTDICPCTGVRSSANDRGPSACRDTPLGRASERRHRPDSRRPVRTAGDRPGHGGCEDRSRENRSRDRRGGDRELPPPGCTGADRVAPRSRS